MPKTRRSHLAPLVPVLVATGLLAVPGVAQDRDALAGEPPIAGGWEPVQSIGQPRSWRPMARVGYGFAGSAEADEAGPVAAVGLYRDLFNPVYGALGIGLQGYVGQRGESLDGGVQLHLESPATFLHVGVDWNARLERVDPTIGVTLPLRRGGWPVPGGQLRLDWIPTRAQSVVLGVSVPFGQPLQGRTRSRSVDVALPESPRVSRDPPAPLGPPLSAVLDELSESLDWLAGLHSFFWLTDFSSLDADDTVRETREALAEFRANLMARSSLMPERATYEREVSFFHEALDRALGMAVGKGEEGAAARGRPLADRLREATLEEVVLPYNRTIGQYKEPDRLDGLAARARARFVAWLELSSGLGPDERRTAAVVADFWLHRMEALRARMHDLKGDSRMQWLPLALVLRPEDHDTQEEIDAIVTRALGRGFERGNSIRTIDALAFQSELRRTIRQTERYHVLWVHDYRGRNAVGDLDRIAFDQTTEGYLRALLDRVRRYDQVGRLPVFLMMVDQFFYEANDARLWLNVLEDPLGHAFRAPRDVPDLAGALEMERRVRALQDSLRAAVEDSRKLAAEAEAFGDGWARSVVKVHVNITNPSDFTFRSRRLLKRPPIGADNLMRDHRKIVIRDVTEADPGMGEVIVAGVGIGEHYASPTWDDRALILRGPGALEAKDRAREVLERHGLVGRALPPPLRTTSPPDDHRQQVDALERGGATARVMQVHNRTGWGQKDASFLQMLIYDLVPPGTVIYVPDSLWSSYEWMAQLVSAALRGCRVYVVAPSLANAPSAEFPVMSTMQELVTRLVLVGEVFGDVIEAAGGELRVGLYTRQAGLDDPAGLLMDVDTTFQANDFLRDLLPFSAEAMDVVRQRAGGGASTGTRRAPVGDVVDRRPKMHRKTQLVVSASVLRALSASDTMAGLLDEALAAVFEESSGEDLPEAWAASLVHTYEAIVEEGIVEDPVLYFLTGSVNKNVRSMALDGEVLAAVAGPWALHAYLDFVLLSGGVSWIRDVGEIESELPSYSWLKRLIARWLYRVL